MPKEIKNQYQYHTKADLRKLIKTGYDKNFYTLENGIEDYINNYLNKKIMRFPNINPTAFEIFGLEIKMVWYFLCFRTYFGIISLQNTV